MIKQGDTLPSFTFNATSGLSTSSDAYRGKWLVLYFYPRDATPGCTTQGENFRDAYQEFSTLNTVILGISRDNLACHERFKAKYSFPFELIDDANEVLCQQFDVMRNKTMYGKPVRGIERSTFLVDPNGVIVHVWRKVTVEGHVADVLATLTTLQKG